MILQTPICLIGDVFVDVTLGSKSSETKMRLGGIVHSARALWALDIPYEVGYFGPEYLDEKVSEYLLHHRCSNVIKLGNVIGTPNVMLIEEPKEIGNQGYESLLRENTQVIYDDHAINALISRGHQLSLVISGAYELSAIVSKLRTIKFIDVANNITRLDQLKGLGPIQTIFISTSSAIFQNFYSDSIVNFINQFASIADEVVIKENRGGSRIFDCVTQNIYKIPAQPRAITHSVGVGDVFDAAYIANNSLNILEKGVLSSWIAAEYAVTTFPDDFKTAVGRVLKSNVNDLVKMQGVSLPWEDRKKINIYIAAPDFDYVNTDIIENLSNSLLYHNFSPRRPIKENGQISINASKAERQELISNDFRLLEECNILLAVLLFDDPGTLIEIGYAKAKGIPTIVYDPYNRATNCMLTELPDLLSTDVDEVLTEIFIQASKYLTNAK